MTDRPINLKAHDVAAILAGRKSQHRVVLKDQATWERVGDAILRRYPRQKSGVPYQPGDRLWCRETHRLTDCPCTEACRGPGHVWYEADRSGYRNVYLNRLRPSTNMPRWASRITLLVSDVRVLRLQSLSEADAIAEGILVGEPMPEVPDSEGDIYHDGVTDPIDGWTRDPVEAFANRWSATHGPHAWDRNPWCCVLTFRAILANIDAPEAQAA